MINVLLTRSYDDNISFIKNYVFDNYNFINCPLLKHRNLNIKLKSCAHYRNIIISSHYAATILDFNRYNFKAWVVGEKSANLLKAKNYEVIYIANNVRDLISKLPENHLSQMLYLSGNIITRSLPKKIKRIIVYETRYAKVLSKIHIELFNQNKIDYILLYSSYSAKLLIDLVKKANVLDSLRNVTVIAISKNVSDQCGNYFGKLLHVDNNSSKAMIELLIKDSDGNTKARQ